MENSQLKKKIIELSNEYFTEIQSIRHHLHSHPELSFKEEKTCSFIDREISKIGITGRKKVGETGLSFTINGSVGGKVIALRADIDALPIEEENKVAYKSKTKGVMHACGHDVHTACLIGAAKILYELREEYPGTVKFIFQPGEERIPGGASILIKEGILENPKPNKILGQHVMPLIETGKVGFRSGMYMASADEIYFTVKGKGGHAAMPENLVDPILITSHIIVALQQIVSRKANPKIPSVLSFGQIIGKGATNVIPDSVSVQGTFRTFNEKWRTEAHHLIKHMSKTMAHSMNAECDMEIKKGYPYLINEPVYTKRNKKAAIDFLGEKNVIDLDLWMAAEDFAYYSHEVDACFYRLGTRNTVKNITSGVHTPTFDVDEEALKTGMGLMTWLTINELRSSYPFD